MNRFLRFFLLYCRPVFSVSQRTYEIDKLLMNIIELKQTKWNEKSKSNEKASKLKHLNLRVHFHNTSKEQDVYQRAWNISLWRKVTRCVPASRPVAEMAVGMAKTPKAVEISKMIAEFIMNL